MTLRRPLRGFTLVELMIVVAIIGILGSVALPVFQTFTYRARQSERRLIQRTVKTAAEDFYVRAGRLEDTASNQLQFLIGLPNPPGVPSASKRPYDPTVPGWGTLGVNVQLIEGALYYSYDFVISDVVGAQLLRYNAEGDLDSDGRRSVRWAFYELREQTYFLTAEFPGSNADDTDLAGVPTW